MLADTLGTYCAMSSASTALMKLHMFYSALAIIQNNSWSKETLVELLCIHHNSVPVDVSLCHKKQSLTMNTYILCYSHHSNWIWTFLICKFKGIYWVILFLVFDKDTFSLSQMTIAKNTIFIHIIMNITSNMRRYTSYSGFQVLTHLP